MKKSFARNVIFVVALVVSLLLSAQINRTGSDQINSGNSNQEARDTSIHTDNAEGLRELQKIIERYERNNFAISGEIYYFDNLDSSNAPDQKSVFTSIVTPNAISYEIDSVQTLSQQDLTLIIDKKEKSMAVFENDQPTATNNKINNLSEQIKEFISYIQTIDVKKQNGLNSLLIHFTDDYPSNINVYEIVYDADSYRVKKIRVEMVDGDIMDSEDNVSDTSNGKAEELMLVDEHNSEISTGYYATLKTSAYEVIYKKERVADESTISLNKLIKKTSEGYEPVGEFKTYDLQN